MPDMPDMQDKQDEQRLRGQLEQEELKEATRRFVHSLLQIGRSSPLRPIARIPQRPRQHFMAAGREFTRGWAALIREFADGIDQLASGSSAPTHRSENDRAPERGHVLVRTHDKE
jgi:hypothetical protein